MDHLTSLDAGFLEAEDSDRHISLAVGAAAVIAGPIPDFDDVVTSIGARFLEIPRFRQLVRTRPFDVGAPEWVDDPHFDLAHHIRRAALPEPGDDEALYAFIAEAMEPRLDRDRPLWRCWIIEGLAGGHWSMLIKVHHCIADGIATMHMLTSLSDSGASDYYVPARPAATKTRPNRGRVSISPVTWARDIGAATAAVTRAMVRNVEGAAGLLDGLLRAGQPTSLVGPVTTMRRFSAVRVPLADITTVRNRFDVTVNDVALAAITDSYRAALLRRGEQPRWDSLRTLVPVSVRRHDNADSAGNRVSVMLPHLPVEKSDAVDQLLSVHRRLERTKTGGEPEAANTVVGAARFLPFALTAWAVRALTKLPQHSVVTLATNVPGPRERLQLLGRDVEQLLPIPPVALGLRTGVAILTYTDQLIFGITGDYDAADDVDELADGITHAVQRLVRASRRRRAVNSALTLVPNNERNRR